jgi:hypothetical protein
MRYCLFNNNTLVRFKPFDIESYHKNMGGSFIDGVAEEYMPEAIGEKVEALSPISAKQL